MYDDELTAQGGGMGMGLGSGWYGIVWYGLGVWRRSGAGHKSYVERTEQPVSQPANQPTSERQRRRRRRTAAT